MLADLSYTTECPKPYDCKQHLKRGSEKQSEKGKGMGVDYLVFECEIKVECDVTI